MTEYHWVTVARFWSPTQALFLKSVLEGNDIPAYVRNEYLGGLFAHFTLKSADGGVELQVPSDRVDEARELIECLEQEAEASDETPETEDAGEA